MPIYYVLGLVAVMTMAMVHLVTQVIKHQNYIIEMETDHANDRLFYEYRIEKLNEFLDADDRIIKCQEKELTDAYKSLELALTADTPIYDDVSVEIGPRGVSYQFHAIHEGATA
jgi:hypothetical protein